MRAHTIACELYFPRFDVCVSKRKVSSSSKDRRSNCPISCALDLLGDRWTLLVLRDLLRGKCRFGQFLASDEGIPTNLLSDRLERLEEAGLVKRTAYQSNPPRYEYELTAKGNDTRLVVGSLAVWGMKHQPGTEPGPVMAALMSGGR